jgi:5-methylcytosine-specific restriction endonuclease McrA
MMANPSSEESGAGIVPLGHLAPIPNESAFYSWLAKQRKRHDPVGDLARDVMRDSSFPVSPTDLELLHCHLVHRNSCREAHCALDEALREFSSPEAFRRGLSLKVRFLVFKRDDYRCQICGATAGPETCLEVDHKHPVSKGGSNGIDNLWTLCFDCNRGKGVDEV